MPPILTKSIGRPPENWNFIRTTVRAVLRSWQMQERVGGVRKKRRITNESRTARPVQHTGQSDPDYVSVKKTTENKDEVDDFLSEMVADSDPEGHPECTSQEDCRGIAADETIRHILDGKSGDIYCRTCWDSFLAQNPYLQGQSPRGEATKSESPCDFAVWRSDAL